MMRFVSSTAQCQFCSECGNALSDGAKFCSACGFPVSKVSAEVRRPVQVQNTTSSTLVPELSARGPVVQSSLPSIKSPVGKATADIIQAGKLPDEGRSLWRPILFVSGFLALVLAVVLFANAKLTGTNSPFLHSMDGTYVSADGSEQATLKISGWSASLSLPGGYTVEGLIVERAGNTLRFSEGELYKGGYIVPGQAWLHRGSKIDLATIGDDGQSISIQASDGTLHKLIRQ